MNDRVDRDCIGCGGRFKTGPDANDSHAYMLSSAGCWSAYGEVLTREYQDPTLFTQCHRLTVDAYAVQHRGDPGDRRAVRSVWLHFAALDIIFGQGGSFDDALAVLRRLAEMPLPELPATTPVFSMTLEHVVAAGPDRHVGAVRAWAQSARAAWRPLLVGQLPAR